MGEPHRTSKQGIKENPFFEEAKRQLSDEVIANGAFYSATIDKNGKKWYRKIYKTISPIVGKDLARKLEYEYQRFKEDQARNGRKYKHNTNSNR